jgi:hypothetical protein
MIAPDSEHVAFKSVVRWALTLIREAGGGHVSEATMARIIDGAWCAFREMAGAELDAL